MHVIEPKGSATVNDNVTNKRPKAVYKDDVKDQIRQMMHEQNAFYDSRQDTLKHIKRVSNLLKEMIKPRARNHDSSKLQSPEKEYLDKYAPKLYNTSYNSEEYKQYLE